MMFKQFFGLKFNPFSKEIPPEQLFESQDLVEVGSRLNYLQNTRGIGLLVGETGSGKSSALRSYVSRLNPALFRTCYFALSTVTVMDFYHGLAHVLGEQPRHRKIDVFHQIQQAISSLYYDKRITPVLVLDEIHKASNKLLEDLQLIFNFKMDSQNPYVLILAGQPPIRNKLSLNVNNPLRQRITVRYFLRGLNHEEVKPYCETRLKLAGVNEEIFTAPALEAMYSVTNGLPRLVNNLATACLLYACGHKKRLVDEETVYQAQEEIDL